MHSRSLLRLLCSWILLAGFCLPFHPTLLVTAAPSSEIVIQIASTLLNPEGNPYEINVAPDGGLWVSDNSQPSEEAPGEIWHYAADGGSTQVFFGLGKVSDARPDGEGFAWFVEQSAGALGQLDVDTGALVLWDLPGGATGFGTALDELGRMWVSDPDLPSLFRFDPDAGEMCRLDLGTPSGTYYLAADGAYLWLIPRYASAVLRLDTRTNLLEAWTLSGWVLAAEGLVADGLGGLWFADADANALVRLDLNSPSAPRLLRYTVPGGTGAPQMLARQDVQVWFSAYATGNLGMLDPDDVTPSSTYPVVKTTRSLDPDCEPGVNLPAPTVTLQNFTPVWTGEDHEQVSVGGWQKITLGARSYPYGIALAGNELWVVTNGERRLLRTPLTASLTACKLSDADGDPATLGDQAALPGWGMQLYQGDALLYSGLTGSDGSLTWEWLETGATYRITEQQQAGWEALGATECTLPEISPGSYGCDFVNWQPPLPPAYPVFLPLVIR